MLEWTGERFLPWMQDPLLAYEHLHRYIYAAGFAKGKRVLDLACGEGYGSQLLARTAQSVIGVDIDGDVVDHANAKYGSASLRFLQGRIGELPLRREKAFDLIVSFEAIEHIEEHDLLLREVKELLVPGGVFMVSTPNKAAYRHEFPAPNPYHVRELTSCEFRELMNRYFSTVEYFGQRVFLQSNIWPLERSTDLTREFVVERKSEEYDLVDGNTREPLYELALASDSPELLKEAGSVLVDRSNELLKERHRAIEALNTRLAEELASLQASSAFRFAMRMRRLRAAWLPEGSGRRRAFNRVMGLLVQVLFR